MKKLFFFFCLLFYVVNTTAQNIIIKPDPAVPGQYIIIPNFEIDPDVDSLFNAVETYQTSFETVQKKAIDVARFWNRYESAQKDFKKLRKQHNNIFPDSTYRDTTTGLYFSSLSGDYRLVSGGITTDGNLYLTAGGNTRFKDDNPPNDSAPVWIYHLNYIQLRGWYATGENVDLYKKPGQNVFIGYRPDGTRVLFRKK